MTNDLSNPAATWMALGVCGDVHAETKGARNWCHSTVILLQDCKSLDDKSSDIPMEVFALFLQCLEAADVLHRSSV